ncbi:unnamed protein product [Symbiodinium sp. CCMP2592]|nr:unnamed protein product [Symbiodinium sp. CCMP2592]
MSEAEEGLPAPASEVLGQGDDWARFLQTRLPQPESARSLEADHAPKDTGVETSAVPDAADVDLGENWQRLVDEAEAAAANEARAVRPGDMSIRSKRGRPTGSKLFWRVVDERNMRVPRNPEPEPSAPEQEAPRQRELEAAAQPEDRLAPGVGSSLQQTLAMQSSVAMNTRRPLPEPREKDNCETVDRMLFAPGRKVASFSALSEKCQIGPQQISYRVRRLACVVTEGSKYLIECMFDEILSAVRANAMKIVAVFEKRRYDETPLPVKLDSRRAKIMQTEVTLALLLEDVEKGIRLFLRFRVPSPLRALDATTAENIRALLLDACFFPGVQRLAAHAAHHYVLVTTDRYGANMAAERNLDCDPGWPKPAKVHLPCDVHKVSQAQTAQHDLIDREITGMVAAAVLLGDSGETVRFRSCVMRAIEQSLEVCYGHAPTGFVREYQQTVHDLYLGLPTDDSEDFRKRRLLQRAILKHFFNGDLQSSKIQHWTLNLQLTRDDVLQQIRRFALRMLLPGPAPIFPRHRWTNCDFSVDFYGLLASHHGLLEASLRLWLGLPQGSAQDGGQQHGQTLEEYLLPKLPAAAVNAENNAADAEADDREQPPDAPLATDAPGVAPPDWAQVNRSLKAKVTAWVQSVSAQDSLAGRLAVARQGIGPVCRLMRKFLRLAGHAWDVEQECKACKGQPRSYRILEAWEGRDLDECIEALLQMLQVPAVFLPLQDMRSGKRRLLFKMASRAVCALQVLLVSCRTGCPYALFSCMFGEEHARFFYELKPCQHDALAAAWVRSFPDVASSQSEMAQDLLTALALLLDLDISQIEAQHASIRRVLMARSCQTHPMAFQDLSADFALRQLATYGESLRRGTDPVLPEPSRRIWLAMEKKGNAMNRELCGRYGAEWRGMSDDAKEPYREIARAEKLSRDLAASLPPAAPGSTQQDTVALPPRVADESVLAVEQSDSIEAVISNAKARIKQTQLHRRDRETEQSNTMAAFHGEHAHELEIPALLAWSPQVHTCVGAPNISAYDLELPCARMAQALEHQWICSGTTGSVAMRLRQHWDAWLLHANFKALTRPFFINKSCLNEGDLVLRFDCLDVETQGIDEGDWTALQEQIMLRHALQTCESPSDFHLALQFLQHAKPRTQTLYLHVGFSNLRTWEFGFLQLEPESGPDAQGELSMVVTLDSKPMRSLAAFAKLNLQVPILLSWYRLSDADEPLGVLEMLPRRVDIVPLQLPSMRVWKGAIQEEQDRQDREHRQQKPSKRRQQKPSKRSQQKPPGSGTRARARTSPGTATASGARSAPSAQTGPEDRRAESELSAAADDPPAEAATADADERSVHSLRTEDASVSSLSEETLAALAAAGNSDESMDAEGVERGVESDAGSSGDSDDSPESDAAVRRPPAPHHKIFSGVPEVVLDVNPHGDVRGNGFQSLMTNRRKLRKEYYFALLRADTFDQMDADFMRNSVQGICTRQMEHGPRDIAGVILDVKQRKRCLEQEDSFTTTKKPAASSDSAKTWHNQSVAWRDRLEVSRNYGPWTQSPHTQLQGLPKSDRVKDLVDLVALEKTRGTKRSWQQMQNALHGHFVDVSQSHQRCKCSNTGGFMPTMTTGSIYYSYEADMVLCAREHMMLQGHDNTFRVPVGMAPRQLRSMAGNGMSLPSLATMIWSWFLLMNRKGLVN